MQGCEQVEFSIPDTSLVDWSVFDMEDDDFFEQYEKYKEFVRFQNIVYSQIECDTLYV